MLRSGIVYIGFAAITSFLTIGAAGSASFSRNPNILSESFDVYKLATQNQTQAREGLFVPRGVFNESCAP